MLYAMILVTGIALGCGIMTLVCMGDFPRRPKPHPAETKPAETKPEVVLDPRYDRSFHVPEDRREQFLVWAIQNHDGAGKYLTIKRWDDGDLCVSCHTNDRALVEAYLAAGYRYPKVDEFPDLEGFQYLTETRQICGTLSEEDAKHVDLFEWGSAVSLCIDPERQDLLGIFPDFFRRDSEVIQEGCEDD